MKDRAYQFPTPEHQCCACRGDLSPGGEFYSTICFLEEEFSRRNYCVSCWAPEESGPEDGGEGPGMVDRSGIFAYWRTRRPEEQDGEVVKIRFDPLLVLEFFRGLGGKAEAEPRVESESAEGEAGEPPGPSESQRRDLRFVLSLLLIRKKILLLKGTFIRDKFEWLELQERRESDRAYEIANPELSETELEQVRDAIGELLQMQV
jgi:hypothetical protein